MKKFYGQRQRWYNGYLIRRDDWNCSGNKETFWVRLPELNKKCSGHERKNQKKNLMSLVCSLMWRYQSVLGPSTEFITKAGYEHRYISKEFARLSISFQFIKSSLTDNGVTTPPPPLSYQDTRGRLSPESTTIWRAVNQHILFESTHNS